MNSLLSGNELAVSLVLQAEESVAEKIEITGTDQLLALQKTMQLQQNSQATQDLAS